MSRSWMIATLIALATVGWVLSGQLTGPDRADVRRETTAAEPVEAAPEVLPKVRVRRVRAEPMVNRLTLQGRTVADRKVEIRAETDGSVEGIMVERGARVEEGDVLVRLTVEDRASQLAVAQSVLAQREVEFNAAEALRERGYRAEISVAESRAALDAARADVKRAELDLAHITVTAPFAGVVDARPTEVGDYLDQGDTVATIVDLDPIRVVGQLAERYQGQIVEGEAGSVRLLDGTELQGTVTFVGAIADPVTRTFAVEVEIPNPGGRIIENVTAELSLPSGEVVAHLLPLSVLTLAADGTLGVKGVDDAGRVVFHEARLLGDNANGVWLGDLPAEFTLITVGQDFVLPGQQVEAVDDDALALEGQL